MPDPIRTIRPREPSRLSITAVAISVAAGCLLVALLTFFAVTTNFTELQDRENSRIVVVEDADCREIAKAGAPIGVIEEYTFPVSEAIGGDTHLAFYTVHQYVDVYIDGQQVYSLKPSGEQFVKTVGCNWTMIPLYREDAGKEVRVEITPVYESFRLRSVQFLIGSQLQIFAHRLVRDLPQLTLGVMAVFIGVVFVGVAVIHLLKKRRNEGLANLGLFSIIMGLWRLTDTRFSPFLMPDKPLLQFYISAGMLMIGMIPLIKSMQRKLNAASRRSLDWCCIGSSGICILLLLLQIFGGVDLRENFLVIHTLIAVDAFFIIGNVIYDRLKHPQNQENVLNNKTALILVGGVLADTAAYYLKGNSSGLVFSLLAMLLYILLIGSKMIIGQVKELAEKDRILAEQERQLTESRIATMVSQIRPHFIYNTLGSIEQLCELQPEAAAKLVHDFSCFLRGNFGEMDNPAPIPLSQEIEHVRYYVSIEQVRFPDIEIRFDLQSGDFLIPALSVQPLVENAIKHGLMKLPHGGTVTVSSYETDTHAIVTVEDNGPGFDTKILLDDRKHIGLRNIRGRIEAMCGGTLEVESTPGVGTKVLISIPKEAEI